jgi:hypothetical protein
METEKMYKEIFKVLNKFKDDCVFDVDDLKRKANCHIFGVKLKEEYGFNINPKGITSVDFLKLNNYISVSWWGEKYRRTISYSDDGRQPVDELLLEISFPSGPYIFGDDYPKDLFGKLFKELKSYKTKYSDTMNHNLYFDMDNASNVFNNFDSIMKKYHDLYKEDYKKRKIEKMKQELEKLEKSE